MISPVAKIIPMIAVLLASFTIPFGFNSAMDIQIKSFSCPNSYSYQYEGVINGDNMIITLEEEVDEETGNPGKVKIIFKKTNDGTTLVYERDMGDNEIGTVDQKYIDKVLDNINTFHKEEESMTNKVKQFLGKFYGKYYQVIKKKR